MGGLKSPQVLSSGIFPVCITAVTVHLGPVGCDYNFPVIFFCQRAAGIANLCLS